MATMYLIDILPFIAWSFNYFFLTLSNISDFEQLSNLKDLNLRELVLTNNPVGANLDEVTYQL